MTVSCTVGAAEAAAVTAAKLIAIVTQCRDLAELARDARRDFENSIEFLTQPDERFPPPIETDGDDSLRAIHAQNRQRITPENAEFVGDTLIGLAVTLEHFGGTVESQLALDDIVNTGGARRSTAS